MTHSVKKHSNTGSKLAHMGKIIAHSIMMMLLIIMTGQSMANEISKQSVQTVCVGRLLIDLPATARIRSWSQSYQGHDLFTIPNVTLEQYQANVKKRIAEWQAEIKFKLPVFDKVQPIGSISNAFIITKWSNPQRRKFLRAESHYWVNGTEIISKEDGEFWPADLPKIMDKLEKLFPRIQKLKEDEMPEGPGFCMNGAWFPQDGSDPYDWEMMDFTFELTSNPDVQFWLSSNTIQNKEPILTRDEKNEYNAKAFPNNIHTLRKGERNIGSFKGQELVERVKEFNGVSSHSLDWESLSPKSSDALYPLIELEAKTGYSSKQSAPINSSLKDDELLKIWDEVLNSIRLRVATPPATSKTSQLQKDFPLQKTWASTGETCPVSGMWRTNGGDGAVRFVCTGTMMPMVKYTSIKPLTFVQKLLRRKPEFTYEDANWKLVEYREDNGDPIA